MTPTIYDGPTIKLGVYKYNKTQQIEFLTVIRKFAYNYPVMVHKVLTLDELISLMKDLQHDQTNSVFAQKLGVSSSCISDIYARRRTPGKAILQAINVRRSTSYTADINEISNKETKWQRKPARTSKAGRPKKY